MRCKDCGSVTRKLEAISARVWLCTTCERARKRVQKARTQENRRQRVYGLTPEQNRRLDAFQGGRCWGCQRATGKTKALAVDHDHDTGKVRAKLCGRCNHDVLGFLDADALRRLIMVLEGPTPAELAGVDARVTSV